MDGKNEPTSTKRNKSGQIVHSDKKKLIISLYKELMKKEPDTKYIDSIDILSEETGIGNGTIKKTLSEYKSTGTVSSPINKKKRLTICEKVDEFDKNEIRQKIHGFWRRREIPTSEKIIQAVKDDPALPNLSRSSFQRVLKDMQFECTKSNGNSALTEKEDLVLWRRKYISDVRRYRQEGRTIYYLDETWVDLSVQPHRDVSAKGRTRSRKNADKGKRIIVVHIGSSEGFVEDGIFSFESKKNQSDHRDIMNGDTFFEWFCGILPLLKDDAVIVMDDAPYHSVKKELAPNFSWSKAAILQWLESKGVVVSEDMIKIELLQKVRQIKQHYEKCVIDEEAKKQNKILLRLPPYHCELNPFDFVWSVVKRHVEFNNTTSKLNDVQQLLNDGIQQVTPEMWCNFITHTINEEDKFWKLDFISDEMLEENDSISHVLTIKREITSDSENSD